MSTYFRLCMFGAAMSFYSGAPWWVWVIGAVCALRIDISFKDYPIFKW